MISGILVVLIIMIYAIYLGWALFILYSLFKTPIYNAINMKKGMIKHRPIRYDKIKKQFNKKYKNGKKRN